MILLLLVPLIIFVAWYIYKDRTNKKPQKVGLFLKVSSTQFCNAMDWMMDYTEALAAYLNLTLPQRATKGSAGYDFYAPFGFTLAPGETIKVPTGVRVEIDDGWWLGILPRSSLGFKYRARLDNTMGVIDSDYYYSDNEGHIFIKLTNCSKDKTLEIKKGAAFAQGIFIPYGIVYDDHITERRNGGFGSTDK